MVSHKLEAPEEGSISKLESYSTIAGIENMSAQK
jgi:hypothetical protein